MEAITKVRKEVAEAVLSCLKQNGMPPGALDLVLTSASKHEQIVLAFLYFLLGAAATEAGGDRFPRVRLVLPEGLLWNVEGSFRHLASRHDPDAAWARVEVVTTPDRGTKALVAAVTGAPPNSAVVCAFLDLYGSGETDGCAPDSVSEGLMGDRVRVFQLERIAVHELTQIGEALRKEMANTSETYVICLSGHGPLQIAGTTLGAVFGSVCVIGSSEEPPEAMRRLQEWVTALQDGSAVPEVRGRIEALGSGDGEVDQVLAIALYQASQPTQAFEILSRVLPAILQRGASADFIAMSARIALEAGRRDEAAALISRVLSDPKATLMALRSATQIARSVDVPELRLRAAELLHERIPNDPVGLVLLAELRYRAGRVEEVVSLLAPHADRLNEEGRYLLTLASYRMGDGGGVEALQTAVPAAMRQRAVADAIWFSAERSAWGQVNEALAVVQAADDYTGEIVRALCKAIEAWSLSDRVQEKKSDDPLLYPRRWIDKAVLLLAARPADVQHRVRLEDAVGPEGLGEVVALTLLLPMLSKLGDACAGAPHPSLKRGGEEEVAEFWSYFEISFSRRERVFLVPERLEKQLDPTEAGRLIRGGVSLLDFWLSTPAMDDVDVNTIVMLLKSLLDLVHTSHDTRTPHGAALAVALVHLVVSGLAMQGRYQSARDLVETAMHIAGGAPDPGVHADVWLALADVRMRGHQPVQAILALVLAARELPSDPIRQSRFRAFTVRLLRDMGFLDQAREQLLALEQIAETHPGVVDPRQPRGLNWSLTLAQGARRSWSEALTKLDIAQLHSVVREAFEASADDVAPPDRMVAASHLVQAVRILRDHGQALPLEESLLRDRIASAAAGSLGGFRGILAETATLDDVRAALDVSVASRYGEDLVQDARMARVVARRILASDASDLATRAAALEVVSDLEVGFRPAVDPPDSRLVSAVTSRLFERAREGKDISGITSVLTPAAPAGRLDRVHQVLADPNGFLGRLKMCGREGVLLEATSILDRRLAHLRVVDGEASWLEEPQTIFDAERIASYGRTYPYGYHEMDRSSCNPEPEVAATLQELGVSEVTSAVTLRCVAPDHRLLSIPANLQPIGNAFAGDLFPTSQVPSLGWLLEAHEAGPGNSVPWNATVWVLRESTKESLALTIGAEELESRLAPLGVAIHRDVELKQVESTPVTWLVAHGGLGLDARHFARVADDRDARYGADDLIAACKGASVVVLLVCSGGRGSHELFAERVRGLPAALLRQGVRVVVASPWPLAVHVGTGWSKAFAILLRSGHTVADAAFQANQSFKGRHPKDRLAMHVYGDPWLRIAAE